MAIPILLDTDIGTDIDDVYALVLAASSPELELRAVTTVNGDARLRARIARAILRLAGREEVPVFAGAGEPLTAGADRGWLGHEGQGVLLPPDESPGSAPDAASIIARLTAEAASEGAPLTIVAIGAMTNLALAIREHPGDLSRAAGIVAMASSFEGFGEASSRPEHNVACDPDAVGIVLASGLPVTLVGLNVTRETRMTEAELKSLEAAGGSLAAAIAQMHRVWLRHLGRDRSPMHDPLAVAAVFRPDIIQTVPVRARVRPERAGHVVFEPAGPERPVCRAAARVDAPKFHSLFRRRIRRAVRLARDGKGRHSAAPGRPDMADQSS